MPTANLTTMFDEVAEQGKWHTPPGMAHWAGSGPKAKTCRECEYWTGGRERYATAKTGDHAANELKPGQCAKYKQITGKLHGRIPHRTPACKHFNAADKPPAITEEPKY